MITCLPLLSIAATSQDKLCQNINSTNKLANCLIDYINLAATLVVSAAFTVYMLGMTRNINAIRQGETSQMKQYYFFLHLVTDTLTNQ